MDKTKVMIIAEALLAAHRIGYYGEDGRYTYCCNECDACKAAKEFIDEVNNGSK